MTKLSWLFICTQDKHLSSLYSVWVQGLREALVNLVSSSFVKLQINFPLVEDYTEELQKNKLYAGNSNSGE